MNQLIVCGMGFAMLLSLACYDLSETNNVDYGSGLVYQACPQENNRARRHLINVLSDNDFSEFALESGIEGVNLDSIGVVTSVEECASLDSALAVIALTADTSFYNAELYNRAYFKTDSLYFSVEWINVYRDTSQIVSGPDYYTTFDENFYIKSRTSL